MARVHQNQLTPEQRFWREVHAPTKRWHKVRTIADMEYRNARLVPKYKPKNQN